MDTVAIGKYYHQIFINYTIKINEGEIYQSISKSKVAKIIIDIIGYKPNAGFNYLYDDNMTEIGIQQSLIWDLDKKIENMNLVIKVINSLTQLGYVYSD